MADTDENGARRDPRYVETSSDLSDWIQVRIVKQFGDAIERSGLLVDLTPRAVKVAFPIVDMDEALKIFGVGSRLLITFRFRDLASTNATATIARLDAFQNGVGIVMFFAFIREVDRESIARICTAYNRATGQTLREAAGMSALPEEEPK